MSSGTSYNGWPADSDKAAIGVVSSDVFPGGAKAGDVTTVLGYVARQFNERVEPIVGGWCWGYTYKANVNNPSQLSCHASGTAIDVNAPDHPNGSGGTFTDGQRGAIYAILDEVQGAVSWLEGYDEMHFEICVDADTLAVVAAGLGSSTPPTPLPPLEGVTMPLIVRRANDVDYAWADNLSLILRIPTADYYVFCQAAGIIDVDHGAAQTCDQNLVEWMKAQVTGSGGVVYEPQS